MAKNKTVPTEMSVESFFAKIKDEARRKDCEALAKLMAKVTKEKATMWGTSIVGFGSYHYVYDSGREGDSCLTGFASRAAAITIYGMGEFPQRDELLAKLGKHKTSGGCLHIRKLEDVDLKVLEKLVAASFKESKRKHG